MPCFHTENRVLGGKGYTLGDESAVHTYWGSLLGLHRGTQAEYFPHGHSLY